MVESGGQSPRRTEHDDVEDADDLIEEEASKPEAADDELSRSRGTVRHSTGSIVSRGKGRIDDDPERDNQTNARPAIADRRKLPSSGGGPAVERGGRFEKDDPERNFKTNAGMPKVDPRRGKSAEWVAPPGKMSREVSAAPYSTGSNYAAAEGDDENSYQTGNSYGPVGEQEISAEGRSLEGDGLDALDPEVDFAAHRNTNVLKAHEEKEEAEEHNHTHAGSPVKLEIVGGPDTGRKKKIKGVRLIIGRHPGVDFQLTDQSVSRKHVELVVGDQGVLCRDMGSGNGTKINGEKVAEKVLVHGDEIVIGKTKIRFVDEVSAFKKAREENEQKEAEEKAAAEAAAKAEEEAKAAEEAKSAEAAAGEEKPAEGEGEGEAPQEEGEQAEEAGPGSTQERSSRMPVRRGEKQPTGLGAVLASVKGWETKKKALVVGAIAFFIIAIVVYNVTRPTLPPPPDPLKGQAAEKMQLARDAVRAERYEDAIKLIEQAEKLAPGIDQTRLATQARNELAVVNALEDVKNLIEQRKFEDARAALAKAPQGSVRTEEAKKHLFDLLAEKELAYKKEQFQQLIAQGEIEAAEQLMNDLPIDTKRELQVTLDEAKANLEKAKKDEQREEALAAGNRAARSRAQKAEAMQLAFAIVQRKFAGQEWARAAAECDRAVDNNPGDEDIRKRAKLLQQLIPNFGRNYDEGKKKYGAQQLVAASRPLRKAWELYQQIDFQTPLGEELKEKLAEASVFAGKEALLREDLGTAALNFRDAVKLNPDDPKAKQLLNEVIGRAEEVYQSAYMIRDRDPKEALKQFKVVVEITPPGSTVHEKAKNQISAMEP
jgi:pSer/pThr/pTyr-binding forkhead associated (FHA) protein